MRAPQGCSRKRQLLGPGCARARGVCACAQAARGGVEHTHYCYQCGCGRATAGLARQSAGAKQQHSNTTQEQGSPQDYY